MIQDFCILQKRLRSIKSSRFIRRDCSEIHKKHFSTNADILIRACCIRLVLTHGCTDLAGWGYLEQIITLEWPSYRAKLQRRRVLEFVTDFNISSCCRTLPEVLTQTLFSKIFQIKIIAFLGPFK